MAEVPSDRERARSPRESIRVSLASPPSKGPTSSRGWTYRRATTRLLRLAISFGVKSGGGPLLLEAGIPGSVVRNKLSGKEFQFANEIVGFQGGGVHRRNPK